MAQHIQRFSSSTRVAHIGPGRPARGTKPIRSSNEARRKGKRMGFWVTAEEKLAIDAARAQYGEGAGLADFLLDLINFQEQHAESPSLVAQETTARLEDLSLGIRELADKLDSFSGKFDQTAAGELSRDIKTEAVLARLSASIAELTLNLQDQHESLRAREQAIAALASKLEERDKALIELSRAVVRLAEGAAPPKQVDSQSWRPAKNQKPN